MLQDVKGGIANRLKMIKDGCTVILSRLFLLVLQ